VGERSKQREAGGVCVGRWEDAPLAGLGGERESERWRLQKEGLVAHVLRRCTHVYLHRSTPADLLMTLLSCSILPARNATPLTVDDLEHSLSPIHSSSLRTRRSIELKYSCQHGLICYYCNCKSGLIRKTTPDSGTTMDGGIFWVPVTVGTVPFYSLGRPAWCRRTDVEKLMMSRHGCGKKNPGVDCAGRRGDAAASGTERGAAAACGRGAPAPRRAERTRTLPRRAGPSRVGRAGADNCAALTSPPLPVGRWRTRARGPHDRHALHAWRHGRTP
jgi:hypothetical protein